MRLRITYMSRGSKWVLPPLTIKVNEVTDFTATKPSFCQQHTFL